MNISDTALILTYIDKNTSPTGSDAFGLPNPKDHDRYCTEPSFDKLMDMLGDAGVPIEHASVEGDTSGGAGTLRSVYFDLAGVRFNVFKVSESQMPVFKVVTKCITEMSIAFGAMTDKPLRIHAFRTVKLLCEYLQHRSSGYAGANAFVAGVEVHTGNAVAVDANGLVIPVPVVPCGPQVDAIMNQAMKERDGNAKAN